MRLTINGFRGHHDYQLELPDNQLVLIQGRSGAGKSTIFQAILWLLYGKMQNIYPHGKKNSYLFVEMELGDMRIKRETKPSRLKVVKPNLLLEGTPAQEEINKLFGSKEFWLTTSYIQQNHRCALLSTSPAERLEVLNRLSFSDEDPDAIISKIDQRLQQELLQQEQRQKEYQEELKQLEAHPIPNPEATPEIVHQLEEEQKRLSADHSQAKDKLTQQQALLEHRKELVAKLDKVNAELAGITPVDLEQLRSRIKELEQAYQQQLKYQQDLPRLTAINKQLETLPRGTPPDQETLYRLMADDKRRKEELDLCQAWNIPYQRDVLDQRLNELTQLRSLAKGDYKTYQANLQRARQIQQELETLPERELDDQAWWEAQQKEKTVKQGSDTCQQWNIAYDKAAIEKRIQEIEPLIQQAQRASELQARLDRLTQSLNTINQTISQTKAKLDKLPIKTIPPDQSAELEAKKKELEQLKQAQQVHICPHCQNNLRMDNGRLVATDLSPADTSGLRELTKQVEQLRVARGKRDSLIWEQQTTEAKRKPLLRELDQLEATKAGLQEQIAEIGQIPDLSLTQLQAELKALSLVTVDEADPQAEQAHYRFQLRRELDALDLTPVEPLDAAQLDREYRALSQVKVIEETNVQHLQKLWTRSQLEKELLTLTASPPSLDPAPLPQLKKELEEGINSEAKRQQLISQRDTFQESIDAISVDQQLETKVSSLAKDVKRVTKQLEIDRYSVELLEYRKYVTEKGHWLEDCRQSLASLADLKTLARKVEYELLTSTVETINVMMEKALTYMFDEPISVCLSLYRQNKSDNRVKPQVNLAIDYRGGEYDNINQLSGGEGDRVSLALTLALNYISGSPILLLDETLSSLDGTFREAATRALRLLEDRLVLVISHEDVEGNYDSSVSL